MASFIEQYLHKSPSDITYDDFKDFYRRKIDENQTLEYKSGELLLGYQDGYVRNGVLDKSKAQDGFIKLAISIAGLANAQGGLFVLGVKEVLVKDQRSKQLIGKRPGAIYPIPSQHIQKEAIEDKLRELIQFPIDDLTILPLKTSKLGQKYIYLIDAPASIRIPHRVDEKDYPQRYNFETRAMVHYQINDLYNKRLAPDLTIMSRFGDDTSSDTSFPFEIFLSNTGRVIAKYPMCIVNIIEGSYTIDVGGMQNWSSQSSKVAQYMPGPNIVVYPSIPLRLKFGLISETQPPLKEQVTLQCTMCAESVSLKIYTIKIDPEERNITFI
jgi:hypothetical protein